MTPERETMELDVLFVGAGPANLSAALRLMRNVEAHNEKARAAGQPEIEDPMVLVIDKSAEVGGHALSGAVVDPVAFAELVPDVKTEDLPFMAPVERDSIYYLTPFGKLPVPGPFVPAEMHNPKGMHLASIGEMCRWLAEQCEAAGVEVYTEFAVTELIREGDRITGARIADKGLDKEGNPTGAFAPGMDLTAKVTVLGEGTRGYLAQGLIRDFGLDADANPQVWGLGLKELIEVPEGRIRKGTVIHTFGYPLDMQTYGGSFIYGLSDTLVGLGLVFGLDYPNARMDSHAAFLKLKRHPLVSKVIEGGTVLEYGAKTLPEGGWFAVPRLAVDGAVLVGDSAGMLNPMRLKGLHLAMHSGILAADRICAALAGGDTSASALDYRPDLEGDWAGRELLKSRNFRQGFHHGVVPGMMLSGLHMVTGGRFPGGRMTLPPDCESLKKAAPAKEPKKPETDEKLYLDILTDVYKSGAVHREDQAPHCHILDPEACRRCYETYAAPCTRFCPAEVYELELDDAGAFKGIQVNFSNCVHCKTCEIKDPLRNIEWVPPEGGDGPKYKRM